MPATAIYPSKFKSALQFLHMPNLSGYLTTQEAADKLGFHVITIRHMLRADKLKGQKVGQMWFVEKQSIEAYLQETAGMEKHDPRRGQK